MKLLPIEDYNYLLDIDPGWVIDTLTTDASAEAYFDLDVNLTPWLLRTKNELHRA